VAGCYDGSQNCWKTRPILSLQIVRPAQPGGPLREHCCCCAVKRSHNGGFALAVCRSLMGGGRTPGHAPNQHWVTTCLHSCRSCGSALCASSKSSLEQFITCNAAQSRVRGCSGVQGFSQAWEDGAEISRQAAGIHHWQPNLGRSAGPRERSTNRQAFGSEPQPQHNDAGAKPLCHLHT
jgi:hypothetical protein